MQYNTCRNCGSNLDPGERCSCIMTVVLSENEQKIIHALRNNPGIRQAIFKAIAELAEGKEISDPGYQAWKGAKQHGR